MAHIESRGFNQIVYETKHHQKALKRTFFSRHATPIDEFSISIPVLLSVVYDKVSVSSIKGTLGYLPNVDFDDYCKFYGKNRHTTICKIYSKDGKYYSAYLCLTITEKTSKKVLERDLPCHELLVRPKGKNYFEWLFGR